MVADEKFTIEIDYIENGFDAVIKHGKQVQKLGIGGKRFSQFQQGGITAQNRNEALARAKAAKASEKAAKATSRAATITQKTTSTASAAPLMGTLAGSLGKGGAARNPLIPSQPFPSQNLTRVRKKIAAQQAQQTANQANQFPMGSFSVLRNPAGNWGAQKQQKKAAPVESKHLQFLKKANMSLFKMQMASLGVYFSFMSIGMALTGLFTGLQNLGGTFKSMALGKAFGGVDVAATMGVDPATLVQGWKNITGIMGMMASAMAALAAAALTPEVMKAIQEMFTALGVALSDGKVAKALGDIIIAFTQMVTDCILPMLPYLADLISALGDAGVLKYIILLVLGAQYLLAGLSMLGFAMQAITLIVGVLSPVITILGSLMAAAGVSIGFVVSAVVLVLFVFDLLINIFENFQQTGWSLSTLWNALYDTFADFYNVLLPIINLVGGLIGYGNNQAVETNSGRASVQNNYNFNGNYDDPSALINQTKKSQSRAY
jgi:hypothetical protein